MQEQLAPAHPQAVAVALLHSYAHPGHERLLGELIAELLPDAHLSLSSDLVGTFREYERTATTVLDAALSPLLGSYLRSLSTDALQEGLPEPQVMQSSGGLTDAPRAAAHAALTVLSGPAGGVGGALLLAELAGERDVLCFDMGGTSCDVCLIAGSQVAETAERTIAGRPLALPALDIHTVGAGGGSIAWRDPGGALRVGPASAGAVPGPACYGRGGTSPTVTDANLLLGRLLEDSPLAGGLALDRPAALNAVSALAAELDMDALACAEGIIRVAESEMLGALRLITVERGIDPRGFTLLPFGGAGPLHAAAMAAELGITRILCPRASGVLCALGLAAAAPRRDVSRTVMLSGAALTLEILEEERDALIAQASAAFGCPTLAGACAPRASLPRPVLRAARRGGRGLADPDALREAFARAHELRYGYRDDSADVELVNIRVSVWGEAPSLSPLAATATVPALEDRSIVFRGHSLQASVHRGELPPETPLLGPALCALPEATLLVRTGLGGRGRPAWNRSTCAGRAGPAMLKGCAMLDPIELQVVTGALHSACQEMGVVLIRSAHSSNIKERRDASTALFDAGGEMVMQAEHIPVHLGAMPAAVAAVLGEHHAPGVSWILNDPFAGGTHLPDITVITPVFARRGSERPGARGAARLCREPRPPRRRRRTRARVDARGQPLAGGGGRRDLSPPAGRADDRGARLAHAPAGRAPGGPARAARRQPHRRRAPARPGEPSRRRPAARGNRCGARLRRAPHARLPGGDARRNDACAADMLEASDGDIELKLRAESSSATG